VIDGRRKRDRGGFEGGETGGGEMVCERGEYEGVEEGESGGEKALEVDEPVSDELGWRGGYAVGGRLYGGEEGAGEVC
jgi:hypothetical protein